jgi:mannosylglycoprotein endo-beta-mannosidase
MERLTLRELIGPSLFSCRKSLETSLLMVSDLSVTRGKDQVCHKRKIPTLVLKLDFAKAFDTINWDGLQEILLARGFSNTWVDWISKILSTSKTAVLVNGCPGSWITCKRGLRQGDPLSPYLFLIVAETLQRLVKCAAPEIAHPVDSQAPGAVLQYADDTLILLKGDLHGVQVLKGILDDFAAATGLRINFSKSSAVPICMEDQLIAQCISALGCKQETFPQTYLGLPLSVNKLSVAAFDPCIAKVDRYLASWQASLLNTMGRVVLAVADPAVFWVVPGLPQIPGDQGNGAL